MKKPKVTVVLGSQWGDEGKGKVVDMLSSEVDIVCRCQGGSNASHTVVTNGRKFYFHLLPSGIMNENCICIIGNGVIIHLSELFEELETNTFYNYQNRLIISNRAHLVFDFHQQVDGMQEAEKSDSFIGTTKKGIGPTYSSKISRTGIRVSDLLGDFKSFKEKLLTIVATYQRQFPNLHVDIEKELDRYQIYAKKLRPFVRDTVSYIHNALGQGKRILVEGANGAMLDVDFGTYPYVTSSNSTIGGVITGLGIPPQNIGEVIGVVKAYTTRVGQGPFPTELKNTIGELLQTHGGEFSIVTQTKRRCGWLDLPLLKYSSIVNGYTAICLTKLDTLDKLPTIDVGVGYSLDGKPIDYWPDTVFDWTRIEVTYTTLPGWQTSTEDIGDFNKLPVNAQNYVRFVENELDIPIRWIGVGPGRDSIITIRK